MAFTDCICSNGVQCFLQVIVKEWDAAQEDAVDMQDNDQEARLAMGICLWLP